jgi:hypothetical protein
MMQALQLKHFPESITIAYFTLMSVSLARILGMAASLDVYEAAIHHGVRY